MIKQFKAKVKQLKKLKSDVYILSFNSPYLAKAARPGQFLHLKIKSVILRRPFSLHKIEGETIYIIFRIRGRGTKALSQIKKGAVLDIIGPLGQGFKLKSNKTNILLAGGIGVAPLVFLAQKLPKKKNLVLLGAKNKKEVLVEAEFRKVGFEVKLSTDDGSGGYKGTVTSLLKKTLLSLGRGAVANLYSCGPKEMFYEINKIIKKYPRINCQVSFEQFMGCGLGICCACAIKTKKGYRKVCKDGPVFNIKDIW